MVTARRRSPRAHSRRALFSAALRSRLEPRARFGRRVCEPRDRPCISTPRLRTLVALATARQASHPGLPGARLNREENAKRLTAGYGLRMLAGRAKKIAKRFGAPIRRPCSLRDWKHSEPSSAALTRPRSSERTRRDKSKPKRFGASNTSSTARCTREGMALDP